MPPIVSERLQAHPAKIDLAVENSIRKIEALFGAPLVCPDFLVCATDEDADGLGLKVLRITEPTTGKYSTDNEQIEQQILKELCLILFGQYPEFLRTGLAEYCYVSITQKKTNRTSYKTVKNWNSGGEDTSSFLRFVNDRYPGFLSEFIQRCQFDGYSVEYFQEITQKSADVLFEDFLVSGQSSICIEYQHKVSDSQKSLLGEENMVQLIKELSDKCVNVLYKQGTEPAIQSLKVIYREMDGVAYTTGSSTKKEIHMSSKYFESIRKSRDFAEYRFEVCGVLIHELTHVWQFSKEMPGSVVEGIADYVRLKTGYAARHWKRNKTRWDEGYASTAFFLDWIERECPNFVQMMNRASKYFWRKELFEVLVGESVDVLWRRYVEEGSQVGLD